MIRKVMGLALPVVAFLVGAGAGDFLKGDDDAGASAGAHATAEGPGGHGPGAAEAGGGGREAAADPHGTAAETPEAHGGAEPAGAEGGHGGKASGHGVPDGGGSHGGGSHGAASHGGGSHRGGSAATGDTTWFQFPQQFFVPVMRNGRLESTMVLSLSLEIPAAAAETAYAHEIKLRDAMLRQLLIHANTGGFDGNFTAEPQLRTLRADLVKTAQATIPEVGAVLIGDIARQDAR